eukprot:TRINITY_DN11463_c0_g5_i1.p1 TRINITY_DN11463_c0_g5~~TRINITY_DN11463_c0_g5_i1.p1  ORF type:complete len:615 (-),score=152.13 TRINITY_DN11463_c0_g5_i1:201-1934(-)
MAATLQDVSAHAEAAEGLASSGSAANGDDAERPTKLFVGGISRRTTTKQLREHFSKYGRVLDCVAMRQPDGRPRGFGYVTLDTQEAADECLRVPQLIDDRVVDIKPAVPDLATGKGVEGGEKLATLSPEARQLLQPHPISMLWPGGDAAEETAAKRPSGFGLDPIDIPMGPELPQSSPWASTQSAWPWAATGADTQAATTPFGAYGADALAAAYGVGGVGTAFGGYGHAFATDAFGGSAASHPAFNAASVAAAHFAAQAAAAQAAATQLAAVHAAAARARAVAGSSSASLRRPTAAVAASPESDAADARAAPLPVGPLPPAHAAPATAAAAVASAALASASPVTSAPATPRVEPDIENDGLGEGGERHAAQPPRLLKKLPTPLRRPEARCPGEADASAASCCNAAEETATPATGVGETPSWSLQSSSVPISGSSATSSTASEAAEEAQAADVAPQAPASRRGSGSSSSSTAGGSMKAVDPAILTLPPGLQMPPGLFTPELSAAHAAQQKQAAFPLLLSTSPQSWSGAAPRLPMRVPAPSASALAAPPPRPEMKSVETQTEDVPVLCSRCSEDASCSR